ncbi:unnamed protein product [Gongylonema pulchrum]|uniref:Protein kinase domain-containing protein n=1 Tax=Gongylonema pulchrum TaxID=637853 RepID=A0A183EVW0_9BILA|nr:unnamed protein product [Gongylonema pulchrum]
MWSVGCVFAELASKKILFQGDSEIDQMVLSTPTEEKWKGVTSLRDYKPSFPWWPKNRIEEVLGDYMDAGGLNILKAMLAYDPSQRISAKRLLKHEYFDDVDRGLLPAGNYDGSTLILGS